MAVRVFDPAFPATEESSSGLNAIQYAAIKIAAGLAANPSVIHRDVDDDDEGFTVDYCSIVDAAFDIARMIIQYNEE